MFRIRNEQMLSFKQAQNERFVHQIATQLQWHFPDRIQRISTATLEKRIADAVKQADTIGIDDDRAVELFASLVILVDPRIREHADFEAIVSQVSRSWFARMRQAYEHFV